MANVRIVKDDWHIAVIRIRRAVHCNRPVKDHSLLEAHDNAISRRMIVASFGRPEREVVVNDLLGKTRRSVWIGDEICLPEFGCDPIGEFIWRARVRLRDSLNLIQYRFNHRAETEKIGKPYRSRAGPLNSCVNHPANLERTTNRGRSLSF